MKGFGPLTRGIAIATLISFAAPQAQALQVYGAETAAAGLDNGPLVQIRAARTGGMRHRGGVHRGGARHGNRGGLHHGYARRGNVHGAHRYANRNFNRHVNRNFNRNANRNAYRSGAWRHWSRPSWYGWPAGGAVAAGAALGFISAAAAAAWAGAAPGPNLCWYYTDPTRRQGFWDACP